jgi:hypothetical protein
MSYEIDTFVSADEGPIRPGGPLNLSYSYSGGETKPPIHSCTKM